MCLPFTEGETATAVNPFSTNCSSVLGTNRSSFDQIVPKTELQSLKRNCAGIGSCCRKDRFNEDVCFSIIPELDGKTATAVKLESVVVQLLLLLERPL